MQQKCTISAFVFAFRFHIKHYSLYNILLYFCAMHGNKSRLSIQIFVTTIRMYKFAKYSTRKCLICSHIYAGMKPTKCLMLYYRKANMHYHTQHFMFCTTLQKQLNLLSLALFILLLQVYVRVWSLFSISMLCCAFNGTIQK